MSEPPHPPAQPGLLGLATDPDDAERRITQWAAGLAAKAQRYQAAGERVEQLRVSATSPDGAVRVTVRADGSITDLEFTERIRSVPLPQMSALILATMRSAQARVVDQVGETVAEELGDEDPQTREAMLAQLRSRFPEPDPEDGEDADTGNGGASDAFAVDDDDEPQAPPPPPAPPPAPPRPPSPPGPAQGRRGPRRDDGDDDFDPDFDPLRD